MAGASAAAATAGARPDLVHWYLVYPPWPPVTGNFGSTMPKLKTIWLGLADAASAADAAAGPHLTWI